MKVYRLRNRGTGLWLALSGRAEWFSVESAEKAIHWRRYDQADIVREAIQRSEGADLEIVEGTR